ncbi:hypothetical protein ACFL0H_01830 [Thermodesulfobacteriota bacterium]
MAFIIDDLMKPDALPDIDKFVDPFLFKVNTDENFQQTEGYIGTTIEGNDFENIKIWTDNFYAEYRTLFLDRIASGKIRDSHGDLHMEHICPADPISVFDCIEFNDRFRYTDTVADIAFLFMDLEYRGERSSLISCGVTTPWLRAIPVWTRC